MVFSVSSVVLHDCMSKMLWKSGTVQIFGNCPNKSKSHSWRHTADGRIIENWTFKNYDGGTRIRFIWSRIVTCGGFCECGNETPASTKCCFFLTSWGPVSFWRRSLFHGATLVVVVVVVEVVVVVVMMAVGNGITSR